MQPVHEFLTALAGKGVKLSLEGDRLNCYAQRGVVTEEIGKEIVRLRPQIVALLHGQAGDRPADVAVRRFALSAGQKGLYMLQRLAPKSSTYNVPICFRTRHGLQQQYLARAWELVQRQFPILTARIVETEAGLCHLLDAGCLTSFNVEAVDIEDDCAFSEFLRIRSRQPFDLERGPLTQPNLFLRKGRDATLLITVHHIVIDGISTVILLRALFSHYQALCGGSLPVVAEAGEGYDAFASWEAAMLSSSEGQAHAEYWKTQLAGMASDVTLPAMAHPAKAAEHGAKVVFEKLSPFLAQRIVALSRTAAVPPAAIFLAAFQLLLHRVTGQDDLVMIMPVMGRAGGRFHNDIGYFINMAPLRSRLDAQSDFARWMRQAQRTMMDAIYHSSYPLPCIVSDMNLSGPQAGSAFRIIYAYQNVMHLQDVTRGERAGFDIEMMDEIVQEGAGDLEVEVFEQESGHTLKLKYQGAAIDTPMARKLLGHLLILLEAVVVDPHRSALQYPLLPAAERHRLLEDFNATEQGYPAGGRLIHELFEAQAAQRPEAVAVCFGDLSISYGELDARANRLARHLIGLGVGPERFVAVYMERSCDLVVALLAVLKAGGAYVPVDPEYPAERIADMLQDSAPRAVLTQASLRGRLPALAAPVVMVDGDAAAIAAHSGVAPTVAGLTSANLAYVIYTSGSTGRPKGAMNEHRAVVNRLLWMQERYGLGGDDRVLQKTPFGFDVSVWEFFWPLLAGVPLVVARPGLHKDPDALADLIESSGVTVLHFVPSMLRVFLDALAPGRCGGIRQVVCSGEELSSLLMKRCFGLLPAASLANLYGPTEAAIDVTFWDCDGGEAVRVPIGRPIANTRMYVLDPLGQPAPIGVTGQLLIGGLAVGRGYLNRPELTADRFLPDPFAARPGARMYKTGDLARWLADGSIDYVGRDDFQVKIRGFRVELGEIEARLADCAGIRDAVVLAREDVPGDKRLVAYVTLAAGAELDIEMLRGQLSASLPQHMVPAAYVHLAELPLTPNGKLDRRALPVPDGQAYASRRYEAPSGADEVTLAAIWSEVLGVEQVGAHDDFFALGGHSLLATRLVALLRERAGVELPLRNVFEATTLRQQAEQMAALRGHRSASDVPPLLPRPHLHHAIMSFAQQRLWFLDQLDHAAGAAYHMPAVLRLRGRLDAAALRAALDALVGRHEILRTRFVQIDGDAVQEIGPRGVPFALIEEDISGLPEAARAVSVDAASQVEVAAPFDLSTGPMIRGRLLRLGAEEHVLLLTQHHIVSDGWSIGIMVRELVSLYGAFSQGHGDPLSPLPIQYADYAIWQRDWLRGEVLQRQLEFWKAHLAGAPALLSLPLDRRRPAQQEYAGSHVPLHLSSELTAGLHGLSQRHGVTLFMTLLAGWSLMMSRLSGQSDVVIGTVVANRQFAALEPLIGFFVSTVAVRVRLDAAGSVAGLLAQIKATMLDSYAHQDVPFEQVVDAVQPPRSLSHAPIFQTLVALDNTPVAADAEMPGLTVSPIVQEPVSSQFDLAIALNEADGALSGGLEYASSLFDRATVVRMAGYLQTLLADMVAREALPLQRLSLLPAAERHRLLEDFNATEQGYPAGGRLIHELFEAQAAQRPEAEAVCFRDLSIAYGDLNVQANRLAHHLRALGLDADDRVGICVERSPRMIVAVLAVLKAGGAYVPIDPTYPRDRIAHMVENSQPELMILDPSTRATMQEVLGQEVRGQEVLGCGSVPCLDLEDDRAWRDQSAENPAPPARHDGNLAYVIYTSGTTGTAKGVMVEHRQIAAMSASWQLVYALEPAMRHLQMANFAFDVFTGDLCRALTSGGCLVLCPREVLMDGAALFALMERERVAFGEFVPVVLRQLLDHLEGDNRQLPILRIVVCGSDIWPVADAVRLQRLVGAEVRQYHSYGVTEATVDSIYFDTGRADLSSRICLPIGRALPNVRLYLLDDALQPVPVGVPGELYIGGLGVARGYLDRPELTADRFLPDPFAARPGARMYKTGDLARWLADGSIDYMGRNDFQVKIRGFRVELDEIETCLLACAGIREAVITADLGGTDSQRLVAYYTLTEGAATDPEALRRLLAACLPDYMLPSAFVHLAELPLTPNGKLDRRALPVPDGQAYASRRYEAPSGADEVTLAAIWSEVLGVEQVGAHDDFFALGGHSLLATRLVALLRERAGVELPLRNVFEATTLRQQAEQMAALRGHRSASDVPPLLPRPHLHHAIMSFAQQRLWFLDQLDHAAGAAYHMPAVLRLRGRLDAAALRAALDALVGRHEILRTRFVQIDGDAVQEIGPRGVPFALIEEDISGLPEAARAVSVDAASQVEVAAPFDLSTGPMIRGRLLRLGAEEHVLLLTQHHIVSDGWSIGIMVRELVSLYGAFSQGHGDPLSPLPIQYADYAIWQRDWLRGEVLQRQLEFWKAHLAGAPALLSLPLDRRRPAQQEYAGSHVPLHLSSELTAGLHGLSQRHGVTLFMTLLAGWSLMMSRLSGQSDVVIGTVVANRQFAALEPLIGFFVSTVAVRVRLDAAGSVAGLLAQIKATMLDSYAHQDVPFEQVVDAVQPPRSLSHAPIFQTLVALDNTPVAADAEMPGLTVSPIVQEPVSSQFDLAIALNEADGALSGGLEYASSLFDRATVVRMAGYLQTLLADMVAREALPLQRLSLLPAAERHRLLEDFNATEQGYPAGGRLIHELFEAQAAQRPEAEAVCFGDLSISYGELDARANRLARHLIGLGVGPERFVAVYMERSCDLVVALLAVLKAGGAYVPVDPEYPAERIADMLQDSAPRAVLTQASLRGRLPALAAPVVMVDGDAAAIAAHSGVAPTVAGLTSANLAYVIYTSGSTGRPKGAMNEHRAVVNRLLWMQERYGLGGDDRVLQKTPFGFDVSVWEFFWPLLAGVPLVVARPGLHKDPDALADLIESSGVTVLHFVPSMLRVFLDALAPGRCGGIRQVVCSGEELSSLLMKRCFGLLPAASLANLYGPTEAAIDVTFWDCDGGEAVRVPIGRPIANTRMYVLDPLGQPAPIGVTGQLLIGGLAVGRGYLNRPELTADRFLPDPFAARPGARMYKTGDLARWLADGSIDYVGRDDFQVKIRGFRVELGEIEARLADCAGIRDAVVLAREDVPGDKRLVAYVTLAAGAELDIEMLRGQLSASLPQHMVPAAYVHLAELPLTPNGKLDRRALPVPDGQAYASRRYEAPSGADEVTLAAIWSEVLGVEQVGAHDDFFALGGHSLLATRLVALLRERAGVELPLRNVFEATTLRQQAEQMAALRGHRSASDVPPLLPRPHLHHAIMSFAQQRLWFLDQLDHAAGAAYHMPAVLRLRGRLDAAALRAALDALVGRHEILRTRFVQIDGDAVQEIGPRGVPFALIEEDISGLPEAARAVSVDAASQVEVAAPFDLSTGPMIRGRLLRLGAEEHVLLLTQHHIVSDGWSIGIMVRELVSLYGAFSQGHGDPLSPLPIQYADYAIWQRDWLRGEVLQRQLEFWKAHLAGAPALLSLPLDRRRPAQQEYAGSHVPLHLSSELTAGLHGLSQRHGVTLFMTLLAGWSLMMSRLSGQSDVVIGTVVANRQFAALEPLIGFFVSTVAVRVRLDAAGSVAGLLAQIKATMLDSYAHQDVPFEQVVDAVQPPRSLSHAPIFQTLVALDNTPVAADAEMPGLTVSPIVQEPVSSQFDLAIALNEADGALSGGLEYASSLFDRATVVRMAGYLQTLLADMVAREALPLQRLSLLPAAERHRLLEDFNATEQGYPAGGRLIHELFEAQAAQRPEAVAVCFRDLSIAYGDLNVQANRLAHHLRALGLDADDRVGICVERSPRMIVAVLAVLKAGGAYVPIDPTYPRDRIAHMVENSQPELMILDPSTRATMQEVLGQEVRGQEVLGCGSVPCLDLEDDRAWRDQSAENPAPPARHDGNLAYVIYTSGTTGTAKGVMVEHRQIAAMSASWQLVYALEPAMRHLQMANFAFDVFTGDLCRALTSGGCLVLCPREVLMDGAALFALMERERVAFGDFVPVVLRQLLDHLEGEGGNLPALRIVVCGADIWPVADAVRLQRLVGAEVRQYHSYGVTEATVDSIYFDTGRADLSSRICLPIGRALPNVRLYLLDDALQPVPVGVPGELYIGGLGVARGYLDRPELTAERFLPDPFAARPGARMYKTGDLARWLADGGIDYMGRNDFQVKIRGFRVELDEIETCLLACAGIREAVVMAYPDTTGDKRLVAYVTTEAGAELDIETIRSRLSASLPSYMVPAAYVWLAELPSTPNGKVDRQALPAPDGDAYVGRRYEAPSSDEEVTLAAIWSEILGVEHIGVHDDFFDLGGHSLLAVQLMARIKRYFGRSLPLATLFRHSNIASLARALSAEAAFPGEILVPIQTQGGGQPIFAVPGAGGNVLSFAWLSTAIDESCRRDGLAIQPFYALQAVGLDGAALPSPNVEETAAANIAAMRTVQSNGPYVLLGHSYGGVVAYEMARQLQDMGETIAALILLDSVAPWVMHLGTDDDDTDLLRQLQAAVSRLFPGRSLDLDLPALRSLDHARRGDTIAAMLNRQGLAVEAKQMTAFFDVFQANIASYRAYRPEPLADYVPVGLLRVFGAPDSAGNLPEDYGWERVLGRSPALRVVEGDHMSMLDRVRAAGLAAAIGEMASNLNLHTTRPPQDRVADNRWTLANSRRLHA